MDKPCSFLKPAFFKVVLNILDVGVLPPVFLPIHTNFSPLT